MQYYNGELTAEQTLEKIWEFCAYEKIESQLVSQNQEGERSWKAFRCSKCTNLQDYDEYCSCSVLGDMRPQHREKGDAEICKKNFELLEEKQQWHEKFSWE